MKELKFLYETSISRIVEEPIIEAREEQGQKVEIKRITKKAKPVKVAIIKPDRKLFKAAEMFYAITVSDYLKAGLLPYSLVAKRYANDGGPLTEREKVRLKELREESRILEEEFYALVGDEVDKQKRRNELLVKINAINTETSTIQNAYSDIFDSTADVKARNDTIEWWSLFLMYIDENGEGYKPIFLDGQYADRITKLEEYEEKADPFYVEVIKRLSYLISFWFASRDTVTSIDFKTMEKLFVDTISKYTTNVTDEVKLTDVTAPAVVPESPLATPTVEIT